MKVLRILLSIALVAAGILIGFGYGRWYDSDANSRVGQKAGRRILHYVDPMHPAYTSDKPGINPETGGDLEPVYENDPAAMPMGTIRVSSEKQQLIGVKFGEVTAGAGTHSFRAVGKVTMDETRFAKVQTRIEGWIEKVYVDFTGKLVEKGQPLLTMYSPEMFASQQEYLLAMRSREIMKDFSRITAAE